MSDEEHAAKEKLMKEKLKKLKERKMPKGQVEFPKESIDEVTTQQQGWTGLVGNWRIWMDVLWMKELVDATSLSTISR